MANSPNPDRVTLSLRIKRDLMYRLEKLAESRKEKPTQTADSILSEATKDVYLTAEDYANISRDFEEAVRRKKEGKRATQANRSRGHAQTDSKTSRKKKNDA